MKRDFELVREILLKVESAPVGEMIDELGFEERDQSEVAEHVSLLVDAGYLDAKIVPDSMGRPKGYIIRRLSWEGHDFLANAKNDTVWKKVKTHLGDKVTTVSMEIMKALLAQAMKEYFKLPG